ncbi:L(3)mbt interactor in ovarian somatic cells [Haematobia irritans]|uniref:L(3)mbt interactor in ovarian somatic cells n=1 Tax=Haematobia irritans TaxID=7368 RepID=UPI003F50665A
MTKTIEEPMVRTTGRIKKPKSVFDPSDNYLPRARVSVAATSNQNAISDRRSSSVLSTVSTDSSVYLMHKEACTVCGKRESKRPAFASKNPVLCCLGCESRIHRLCLKVDLEDFEQVRQNFNCEKCTPCGICHKVGNQESTLLVLICSKCAKVYHNECLAPKAINMGEDQPRDWNCTKCIVKHNDKEEMKIPVKKIREIIGEIQPQTVSSTTKAVPEPSSSNCTPSSEIKLKRTHSGDAVKKEVVHSVGDDEDGQSGEKRVKVINSVTTTFECSSIESSRSRNMAQTAENLHVDGAKATGDDIPDVKNWSVDDVYSYFSKQFPKEAFVFKDQEIDGRSLLLLKRSDIVKKLPLKLGPSLRIYSVILKIQSQLNDPTLGWHCTL